jgi:poly-gamma-glutamate capsule biosynthesis protein CapA/YwtB (metallophosphatase superfamily)
MVGLALASAHPSHAGSRDGPLYPSCRPGTPPWLAVPRAPDAETAKWLPAAPLARYRMEEPRPLGRDQWRIVAVGDIMTSREVLWTAAAHREAGASPAEAYMRPFTSIQQLLTSADLAIGNLEFPVRADRPPEGCKPFNGEPAYLDALKSLGVDILFTANNHMLDQGLRGSDATLEELQRREFATLGTVRAGLAWQERLPVTIGRDAKLNLAFLNYTSGIADDGVTRNIEHLLFGHNVNYAFFNNGERLTKRLVGAVAGALFPSALIPSQDEFIARVAAETEQARAEGAEYIIAFMSWGKALAFYPSVDQRRLAHRMCDGGVDAIIGAGPHTIQPVEMLQRQDGSGGECLVAYSLGNLIGGVLGLANYGLTLEITLARGDAGVLVQNYQPHLTLAVAEPQGNPDRPVVIDLKLRPLAEFVDQLQPRQDQISANSLGSSPPEQSTP